MKRFLQWFIVLLQILFGFVFIAAIGLYVFGKFDIASFKDNDGMKYAAYAAAGLYAVLSAVTMAVVLVHSKVNFIVIDGGDSFVAKVGADKIRKLLKKTAASVEGVKLKGFYIKAKPSGYILKLKINVSYRNVKEAAAEFEGVAVKLFSEIYGFEFAAVDVIVGKVKEKADIAEIKREVRTDYEIRVAAEAAEAAKEREADTVPTEDAPQYFAPSAEECDIDAAPLWQQPEPEPEPVPEPAAIDVPQPEPVAETVFVPKAVKTAEPIIKTETAVKTAKAPAKAKAGSNAAAKPATKTAKQKINPDDPPPFKL